MPQEPKKFDNGTILDSFTVSGHFHDDPVTLEIQDGGLPENTFRISIRQDKKAPDNGIIVGAFVKGRMTPVTVIGKIKS